MKIAILSSVFATAVAAFVFTAPAQAAGTMKECAAQWKTMKDAKQTGSQTYREFSKTCMSKDTAAAPAAAPAAAAPAPAAPAVAAKPAPAKPAIAAAPAAAPAATPAKPVSEGRAAELARQRACGAEWKADKAAGKIQAGMKWPQYWSACNTRKKAQAT